MLNQGMKKHQIIISLIVCLLTVCCSAPIGDDQVDTRKDKRTGQHLDEPEGDKPGRPADRGSGKEVSSEDQHFRWYAYWLPDGWNIILGESILDIPDRWELMPIPYIEYFPEYVVYGDQNHAKARFCFQGYKGAVTEPNPLKEKEFEEFENAFEQVIIKKLKVDTVNLTDRKQVSVNGFDGFRIHYTYESPYEKGDIIIAFLYKDADWLIVCGTFSTPLYAELQKDITAILGSIRKPE
jgi:hypothetical protein